MTVLLLAVSFVLILSIFSVRANNRLRNVDRLPMQWSLTGKVNWTAPRPAALAFTPVLAAVVLFAAAIGILASGDPRPGQAGMGVPVILLIGFLFVAVHALHLRLIDRSVG